MLLDELAAVITLTPPNAFKRLVGPIFDIIAKCIEDDHFQVAERALLLWRSEYFVSLVAQNRHAVLPRMYTPLQASGARHWHPQVALLARHVLKLFNSMDPGLFQSTAGKHG